MPSVRGRGGLPTTSFAVLGLLSFGEMSGYDLKGLADYSIANFFWSPARSQIYAELRRLTSLGFVTETEVRQERRPDKRIYRLTSDGRRALSEWLEIPEVEPDIFKSTFLLKIFLGRLTPTETIVAQVEERVGLRLPHPQVGNRRPKFATAMDPKGAARAQGAGFCARFH